MARRALLSYIKVVNMVVSLELHIVFKKTFPVHGTPRMNEQNASGLFRGGASTHDSRNRCCPFSAVLYQTPYRFVSRLSTASGNLGANVASAAFSNAACSPFT